MGADNFQLQGGWSTDPLGGDTSFVPSSNAQINEALVLQHKTEYTLSLNSDSPTAVAFGGVTNASVVILKAHGGNPVVATITSAAGVTQTVPLDPVHVTISQGTPITAISLTRTPTVETDVDIFLGDLN